MHSLNGLGRRTGKGGRVCVVQELGLVWRCVYVGNVSKELEAAELN